MVIRRFLCLVIFLVLGTSGVAFAETPQQRECRERVAQAAEGGFILDLDVTQRGVEVVVHEGAWHQTDYTTKLGMAEAISCMLTEEGEQARVVVLSNRTNNVLAEGYPADFDVR